MKLLLVSPGKPRLPGADDLCGHYLKLLRQWCEPGVVWTKPAPRELEGVAAMEAESAGLLAALPKGEPWVALDQGGTSLDSPGLSRFLANLRDRGAGGVGFVVGGPYGLAPEVLRQAPHRMSLSAMTLPHDLARVVVLEQLYRALAILHGHPYHK